MSDGTPGLILGLDNYALFVANLRVGVRMTLFGVKMTNLSAKNVGTMNRRTE